MAACGHPQSRILNRLESNKIRRSNVGCPRRSREVEFRANEHFVGKKKRLLILAPGSARHRLQDAEAVGTLLGESLCVLRKGVERVKREAENRRVLFSFDDRSVEDDLRFVVIFVRVRREKG